MSDYTLGLIETLTRDTRQIISVLTERITTLEAERDAALGSVLDHVLIPRTTYNQIVQALTNCKDHKLPRVSVRRNHLEGVALND